MVLIHEKITALLEQRHLKKRDLARALGISPQTATDICKGRSAITLPHLRNLVAFFQVRADFWLDEDRLMPGEQDSAGRLRTAAAPAPAGTIDVGDPEHLLRRLRRFLQSHRAEFLAACPDLTAEERRFLGLHEAAMGSIADN
jgi:transcriptional regulator with XRE-family HTH domain